MSGALRIFISSTFRDLQEERSHLMTKVFPEIRRLCHEREVEFTEIDLRWGLTREESTLGRVLRSCFEEIDQCRPYFLAILGTRYGWVPDHLDIAKDPELIRRFPWIEEAAAEGTSLLEMEMRYGVLDHGGAMPGAFVYVQSTAPGAREPRMRALVDRVRARGMAVRDFESAEALGQLVRGDLLRVVERDFPLATPHSRLEQERRRQRAIARSRRRGYVPNPTMLAAVQERAARPATRLAVVGPAGSGRSALLAHWAAQFERRHPDALVITLLAGSGTTRPAHVALLRNLLEDLQERCGIEETLPVTVEKIVDTFPRWLALVAPRRLMVILDDLSGVESETPDLSWLPRHLPAHVSFVVSMPPGETATEAAARGWDTLTVPPLTPRERETIAVRFLSEFGKSLSVEQLARIANDPKCASPLFLRSVLEELRVMGRFENLDERIAYYLEARDHADLFQRILARLEQDFGAAAVRGVTSLLWAARYGLSDAELRALTDFDPTVLGQLMAALDFHLVNRDGLASFSHAYLRRAVADRYLASPDVQRSAHRHLGAHFAHVEDLARRADEEPWHWLEARDWKELQSVLTAPPLVVRYGAERLHELILYWRGAGEHLNAAAAYAARSRDASVRALTPADQARYFKNAGGILRELGLFDASCALLTSGYELVRHVPELANVAYEIGGALLDTLYWTEDFARALALAGELRTWLSAEAPRSSTYYETISTLGAIEMGRNDLEAATALFREALLEEEGDRTRKRRIANLNNLATTHIARREFMEAGAVLLEASGLCERLYGRLHPDTARVLANLALVRKESGTLDEAEALYREAVTILEAAYGRAHPSTAEVMANLAVMLIQQKRYEESGRLLDEVAAVYAQHFGAMSFHLATVRLRQGVIAEQQGDLVSACAHYRAAVPIMETRSNENDPRLAHAREFVKSCGEAAAPVSPFADD